MKRMLLAIIILTLISLTATAAEQRPPALTDYSLKWQIDAGSEGALYRLHLTPELLRDTKADYRHDIAVFNASGDVVPFLIENAATPFDEQAHRSEIHYSGRTLVPAFVMPGGGPASSLSEIIVRSGGSGEIVEVRGGTANVSKSRILLDLSSPLASSKTDAASLAAGRIELSLLNEENVAASVRVDASDNLKDWKTVVESAPLLWLKNDSARVETGFLETSQLKNYLLLEVSGNADIDTGNVFVSLGFRPTSTPKPDVITVDGIKSGDRSVFTYDTGGSYPAERISFSLKSPGIHTANLDARRATEDEWHPRGTVSLVYVKNEREERRNSAHDINSPQERYWLLSTADSIPEPPTMQIAWQPKEIVFMAQGASPYLLVTGLRADRTGASQSRTVQDILVSLSADDIKIAHALSPEPIAEAAPPTDPTDDTPWTPWGQYAVWTLLAVGALLLSWMAWSLLKKSG